MSLRMSEEKSVCTMKTFHRENCRLTRDSPGEGWPLSACLRSRLRSWKKMGTSALVAWCTWTGPRNHARTAPARLEGNDWGPAAAARPAAVWTRCSPSATTIHDSTGPGMILKDCQAASCDLLCSPTQSCLTCLTATTGCQIELVILSFRLLL